MVAGAAVAMYVLRQRRCRKQQYQAQTEQQITP
jgi:hypothetical protein